MNPISFALILAGVGLNATAQLLLKAGANHLGAFDLHAHGLAQAAGKAVFSAPIIGGLLCYVLSVMFWIVALTRVDVSVAYPMLSIGYIVTAIAAWALFGEALTPMRVAGIVVIIVGVYLVAGSAHG